MADKICREAAEKEVEGWSELFRVTLDLGTRESIVRALMDGRIIFDKKAEIFTIQLRKPIRLENGETITFLKLEEPDARQLRDADKAKDDFESVLRLLSSITGHPLGVLDRLKQKDLTLTGGVFTFFA